MGGDGCPDDYTERNQRRKRRVTQREEKKEMTRNVEREREGD